ncbi:MAG: hypothetical protein ACJA1A_003373 [Saprospiraceae bacterium]|jgi:hypothetical protein
MSKLNKWSLFAVFFLCCFSNCKHIDSNITDAKNVVTDTGTKDPKAVAIANKVMDAMGGQQKWDAVKYVSWTFFGARHLLWDKQNSLVRIKNTTDSTLYLVDLETGEGKKITPSKTILHSDDQLAIDKAKSIWINDMYWLFMPFKLMDPGVNLKYLRQDTTKTGIISDVLELTFNEVGVTPDNKYEVYVDQSDNLIKQWNFFNKWDKKEPSAVWPWDNYKSYNGLLLSADRSDKKGPSNVMLYETVDEKAFTEASAFKFPE